jgi:hypothetical protein
VPMGRRLTLRAPFAVYCPHLCVLWPLNIARRLLLSLGILSGTAVQFRGERP